MKMTENPWQQTSDPYPATSGAPSGTPAPPTSQGGTPTKTEAAKDEAANVAGQAAGAAQNVAATAKEEASNVVSEVKTNTRDLLYQAKSDLTSQAGTQQQKAAEGIHSISSQLRTMADAPDQPGVASDLVRQAADRSASIASWLENRDPGSLLEEAKTFARQRPGAFLLIAAGAGLVAGRLARSLQAGAPTSTPSNLTEVPPRPTQQPAPATPRHQETVIAAGTGDHFFEAPTAAGTASPAATTPTLAAHNDPFTDVEGRQP
ncbi:hypothetical protein NKCBBBOE_02281 [Pseudarthrobacter sp. MM222]|nr:hypothetical protein NKCBBBOE_02281 [Pseudarthrobacter sp. MM222]